ncbi:MAG: rhodanese, partial [Methylobacterium sp.]
GYTAVHWFPDGIEGWQDKHETAVVREDPEWARKPVSAGER